MNRKKLSFVLICCLIFLSSCLWNKENSEEILTAAESLMAQHPDSVLDMLDMLSSPQSFPEDLYNKYLLLYIQAKDKNDKDISEDTMIFKVRDYYLDKGNLEYAGWASFYAARVLLTDRSAGREEALKLLKDAEQYTKSGDDYNLRGLIQYDMGVLHISQSPRNESILRFKEAVSYFEKSDAYKNEIISYNQIGRCFHSDGLTDSAFHYYDKALSLATAHNDSLKQASVKLNMGVAFDVLNNKDSARIYYKEALPYFSDIENKIKTYTNIARTFNSKTERDSILYYTDISKALLEEDHNPKLMALVYRLLAKTEEERDNHKESLAYQKLYVRQITEYFKEAQNEKLLDVQRKYDFELIKNENNRLFIQKQSGYLVALILFLVVLATSFVFYRKSTRGKEKLLDAQQKILQLKDMANTYDKEKTSVRNVLIQHFDILKKAALLESYLNDDERKQGEKLLRRFNEIVYNQDSIHWDSLFSIINHLSDNFPDKLRRLYPGLDDTDFRICCLTEAELTNMEIAIIMGLSVNTVQMRKSNMRKKLGIEGYGNIVEYLKREMEQRF